MFDLPREKLKAYFSRGSLFFSTSAHLAFVCGSGTEQLADGTRSVRALYIDYVLANPSPSILPIRAETAATELLRQLEERERTNLAHFEKLIAETVDSVLIFPESPGSFAELGFFSAHEDISKKTLVAVKEQFQDNSFISLGPIHHISSVSKFRPMPIILGGDLDDRFKTISERLAGSDAQHRPYRNRFDLQTFKDYGSRNALALLDEIVEITGALTEPDLKGIIHDIFGAYDIAQVRMQLSLLVAMNRIRRNSNGDIFTTGAGPSLMESDDPERVSLKARWLNAFASAQPEALQEMRGEAP